MSLTEKQKRLRAEAYGASQLATIVGEGYGSLMELYAEKIGQPAPETNFDDNLPAALGTFEEPAICDEYARRTSTFLARVDTLRHPTNPLIIATPDRARFANEEDLLAAARHCQTGPLVLDSVEALESADRLVEAKRHAAQFRKDYGDAGSGVIPAHEAIQCTVQMAVTGKRLVDLPVLFASEWGCKLETFTVAWNPDLWEWLVEAVERFHRDHVLKGVPPPPDATDKYSETMGRLNARASKTYRTATVEEEELMQQWMRLEAVAARATHYKALVGQELMGRIGAGHGLESAKHGKLAWISVREAATVNWHQAAGEFETLAGQCITAFGALRAAGEHLTPEMQAQLAERLQAIIPNASKPRRGFRYLRAFGQAQADLKSSTLALSLPPTEEK